jgi:hypothetical protein
VKSKTINNKANNNTNNVHDIGTNVNHIINVNVKNNNSGIAESI